MSDEVETRVVAFLDALGAPYELIPIDPAFADTAEFCARYGYPPDHAGNTIICASKKEPRQYCACLVTATTRLDVNHVVRQLLGASRVSFASADETQALTGMMIGGVTVLALPPELSIYIDDRVTALDYLIAGSGSHSSKIKMPPEALQRLANARIVPGLAMETRAEPEDGGRGTDA